MNTEPKRDRTGDPAPETNAALYAVFGEVAERVQACLREGIEPDVEALIARYPDHETHVRELVSTLLLLEQLDPGHRGASDGSDPPVPDPDTPGRLGDYRILREVARGGMGVVYEAEQISLERRVALKVLPFAAVLDGKQLRRFKTEAQAAAHLQHQNIVPVYSVGCERGVHYYAMQLIEGSTLMGVIRELRSLEAHDEAGPDSPNDDSSAALETIAPERSSSTPAFFRAVANLGIQVAAGLEHAHELGVVHRDIKPSNLLIDEGGHVWITDFGLARVEGDAGMTLTGELLGTVRYMSPEQAAGKHVLLDHRSDIYSLGVTLYELLTLRPAFDGADRRELLEKIATADPRRPRRWNAAVPPDLETIVLKAAAKEPESRYASAKDLGADLARFLEHQPIRARRPSLSDRVTKWCRRHVQLVASAAGLLVLSVVGLSISTALIWREQGRTSRALGEAEEARAQAEADQALSSAVYEFMHHTLTAFDSGRGDVTLRSVLDGAAEAVEGQFADQPLVGAEVRNMIQAMYFKLGEFELAERYAREMTDIRSRVLGPADPETLAAKALLAGVLRSRGSSDDAIRLYREVYEGLLGLLGERDVLTLEAMNNLALGLQEGDRLEEAESLARRALRGFRELLPEADDHIRSAMNDLALVLTKQGQLEEAGVLYESSLDAARTKFGREDRRTITAINNLGWHHFETGHPGEAEPLFQEALELIPIVHGDTHPLMVNSVAGMAGVLRELGRRDAAEALFQKTLERIRERRGDANASTLRALKDFACFYHQSGDPRELPKAEPLMRDRLRILRDMYGERDPRTREAWDDLALQLRNQGDLAGAERMFGEIIDHFVESGDGDDPDALHFVDHYVEVLERRGRVDDAIECANGLVEDARRALGDEDDATLSYMNRLGVLYANHGRHEDALGVFEEQLELSRHHYGLGHPVTVVAFLNTGRELDALDEVERAADLFQEGILAADRFLEGDDRWTLRDLRYGYGDCLTRLRRYGEAKANLLVAYEGLSDGPSDAEWRERIRRSLVALYDAWATAEPDAGHEAEAARWRAE